MRGAFNEIINLITKQMKVDPEIRAKKASLAISLIREKQTQFESKELIQALQAAGCPYPNLVPSLLKKLNIIQKKGNYYEFVKQEPVHYKLLESGLTEFSDYYRQYYAKSQKSTTTVLKPIVTEESAMIAFLKSKGYKIYRPEYIEV